MLKNDSNYRKIRLVGRSWFGQASYWIGPNHLLVVEVSNYVERYRRFYFRDVQTLIIQNSPVRLAWNMGFGTFAALTLIGLLSSGFGAARDNIVVTIWLIFFLLFTVCLLLNTLRGPSCTMHLHTAVQTQKLPGISRWRKAEALAAALIPLINPAQSSPMGSATPPLAPAATTPGFIVDDPSAPPRSVS